MQPFGKPISELVLADIQTLIQNSTPEGRALDYKRDMYGGTDAEKKEFLCDASAFANTVGGCLIIGVDEDKGIPKSITPIAINDLDMQQQQFENLLRTAVDPPIRGVEFQAIDAGRGRYIMVLEIPRSISRPHAVNHKGHWRFYGRNSVGKYPYEVDDVRQAMLQSETLAVKIRNFRNDRLSQIAIGETPVPMRQGAKVILHLVPAASFDLGSRYDLPAISTVDAWPIHPSTSPHHRVNFDGIVTYDIDEKAMALSYTQLFRSGILEAVDAYMLTYQPENKVIPRDYEGDLARALQRYKSTLVVLGVGFPVWVCLSLIGVRGYQMGLDMSYSRRGPCDIDRDDLVLTEIQMDDIDTPADCVLKPAFDSIWNACGLADSLNYDENGRLRR